MVMMKKPWILDLETWFHGPRKQINLTSNLTQTGHTLGKGPVPHCARDLAVFATLF
jgi:hypothetical protein